MVQYIRKKPLLLTLAYFENIARCNSLLYSTQPLDKLSLEIRSDLKSFEQKFESSKVNTIFF